MSALSFKELKKEKIDHFFTIYNQQPTRVDVVANTRIYINDEQLSTTAEIFMKNRKCFRTIVSVEK